MTPPPAAEPPRSDQRKVGWGVATACGIPALTYLVVAELGTTAGAYGIAMIAVAVVSLVGLVMFAVRGKRDFASGMLIGAVAITIIGFPACVAAIGGG